MCHKAHKLEKSACSSRMKDDHFSCFSPCILNVSVEFFLRQACIRISDEASSTLTIVV